MNNQTVDMHTPTNSPIKIEKRRIGATGDTMFAKNAAEVVTDVTNMAGR